MWHGSILDSKCAWQWTTDICLSKRASKKSLLHSESTQRFSKLAVCWFWFSLSFRISCVDCGTHNSAKNYHSLFTNSVAMYVCVSLIMSGCSISLFCWLGIVNQALSCGLLGLCDKVVVVGIWFWFKYDVRMINILSQLVNWWIGVGLRWARCEVFVLANQIRPLPIFCQSFAACAECVLSIIKMVVTTTHCLPHCYDTIYTGGHAS